MWSTATLYQLQSMTRLYCGEHMYNLASMEIVVIVVNQECIRKSIHTIMPKNLARNQIWWFCGLPLQLPN